MSNEAAPTAVRSSSRIPRGLAVAGLATSVFLIVLGQAALLLVALAPALVPARDHAPFTEEKDVA